MDKTTLDFVFDNCPCVNLGKAIRNSTRFFDDLLSPLGLNASKLILFVSIERIKEEGATQKKLSEDLSIQQSSLSRSLSELKNKGWIDYKKEQVGTKTINKIFLSPQGEELLEKAVPILSLIHI